MIEQEGIKFCGLCKVNCGGGCVNPRQLQYGCEGGQVQFDPALGTKRHDAMLAVLALLQLSPEQIESQMREEDDETVASNPFLEEGTLENELTPGEKLLEKIRYVLESEEVQTIKQLLTALNDVINFAEKNNINFAFLLTPEHVGNGNADAVSAIPVVIGIKKEPKKISIKNFIAVKDRIAAEWAMVERLVTFRTKINTDGSPLLSDEKARKLVEETLNNIGYHSSVSRDLDKPVDENKANFRNRLRKILLMEFKLTQTEEK